MPMPPLLPILDWRTIFQSGVPFETWLNAISSDQNRQAIERGLADLVLDPQVEVALAALPRPVYVLAIAEDWCGDVRRHVPVLQRLARTASDLDVRYITRAQHTDVLARFLTNGGEAIPKFVFLSDYFVECGNWGPMPSRDRILISRGKACGDVGAARKLVAQSYQTDPDREIVVRELMDMIDIAVCTTP